MKTFVILLLSVVCLAQSPPKKKASDFISGECEIGARYDTKGDCIINPTPAQKRGYGYIADVSRQKFWAKQELLRRASKKTDCSLKLYLQGVTDDHQLFIRCAEWETALDECLSKPNATFERCERKF